MKSLATGVTILCRDFCFFANPEDITLLLLIVQEVGYVEAIYQRCIDRVNFNSISKERMTQNPL